MKQLIVIILVLNVLGVTYIEAQDDNNETKQRKRKSQMEETDKNDEKEIISDQGDKIRMIWMMTKGMISQIVKCYNIVITRVVFV